MEIYAAVDRFHGSVEDLSQRLLAPAEDKVEVLLPHLYIHYDDGAVSHLFQVAAGLDSMAVGEAQILGQTRDAPRPRPGARLGRPDAQHPLPAGPARRQARPRRDRHRPCRADPGRRPRSTAPIDDVTRAVGSWSSVPAAMAGLAVATVVRRGAAEVVVVNRTPERAERLAGEYAARWAPMGALGSEIANADLVIACAGASGVLISREVVAAAPGPLAMVDLALPHDIDPSVVDLPGVTLVTLADLAGDLQESEAGAEVEAVRTIVTDEVEAFLSARRQAGLAPTVVALRTMATGVVESEMARLERRLPGSRRQHAGRAAADPASGHRQAASTSRRSGPRSWATATRRRTPRPWPSSSPSTRRPSTR